MNPVSKSQASLNLIKNLKRINKGQWSKDLRHHGCCQSLIQTPGSLQSKPKPNTSKRRDKTNMSSHEISTKCQRVNRKISEWLHMELMSLIFVTWHVWEMLGNATARLRADWARYQTARVRSKQLCYWGIRQQTIPRVRSKQLRSAVFGLWVVYV